MWIPEWLYERLPLIYLVAGMASLLLCGATLAGLPSAALFCAAGLRVYALRHSVRQAKARRGGGHAEHARRRAAERHASRCAA